VSILNIKGRTTEGVRDGLAWWAFLVAGIGGIAAPATWVGDLIVGAVHIGPWWLPFALFVGFGLAIIGDVFSDGIPNRFAVYAAIVWPSFPTAIEGKAGDKFRGWFQQVNDKADDWMAEWVVDSPTGSRALLTALCITAITFAVVWAQRYAKQSKSSTTARPGVPNMPARPGGRS
jgi:hypothetical protein